MTYDRLSSDNRCSKTKAKNSLNLKVKLGKLDVLT